MSRFNLRFSPTSMYQSPPCASSQRVLVWNRCCGLVLIMIALAALAQPAGANGFTLKTLHTFCERDGCPDGKSSVSGLVLDKSGVLYGTAYSGGEFDNSGRVYALTLTN